MAIFKNTKEPTEMDKVMENIAQVEGEIQQKIFQLGQLYYASHKDNFEGNPQYDTLVDLINKLDQNRKGYYKNKLRLEGYMMCENCGATIPYGSMYCNVCGKKADEKQGDTEPAVNANAPKCAKCGALLEEGSAFCTACGAKVE